MRFFIIMALMHVSMWSQKANYRIGCIAFYNVENLFDYIDNPTTLDDDRTPDGKDHWTQEVYHQKIENTARVLSEIGTAVTGKPPLLIGLAEIENFSVLKDLVIHKFLKKYNYGIIHFDSPDRRGIDVALLYQKTAFTVLSAKAIAVKLFEPNGIKNNYTTRDQLAISGYLYGEKMHIIVNHWPSRRGGTKRSAHRRIQAARVNKRIIDSIKTQEPYAKIVNMGDFNDDPKATSIKKILKAKGNKKNVGFKGFFNPMETMFTKGYGTLAYRDHWNLFDQILMSSDFVKNVDWSFYKAGIFSPDYLITKEGRYKEYPFRSHSNGFYTGGFSDHFPVYVYVIKKESKVIE